MVTRRIHLVDIERMLFHMIITYRKRGHLMKAIVNRMVNLSIILNILVLIPVVSVILFNLVQVERVWGINQPSRQILVSIYIAILIASIGLYFLKGQTKLIVASTVFSMQIMYKTLTLFLVVNAITNPVVLSNLVINVVRVSTLVIVLKHYPNLLK